VEADLVLQGGEKYLLKNKPIVDTIQYLDLSNALYWMECNNYKGIDKRVRKYLIINFSTQIDYECNYSLLNLFKEKTLQLTYSKSRVSEILKFVEDMYSIKKEFLLNNFVVFKIN
jgi:hypothetical protein